MSKMELLGASEDKNLTKQKWKQYCGTPCTKLQCCKVAMFQSCNVATYQCCNVVMFQTCKLANYQSCKVAKLQYCNVSILQSSKVPKQQTQLAACPEINFPEWVAGWEELEIRLSKAGAGAWPELGKNQFVQIYMSIFPQLNFLLQNFKYHENSSQRDKMWNDKHYTALPLLLYNKLSFISDRDFVD